MSDIENRITALEARLTEIEVQLRSFYTQASGEIRGLVSKADETINEVKKFTARLSKGGRRF